MKTLTIKRDDSGCDDNCDLDYDTGDITVDGVKVASWQDTDTADSDYYGLAATHVRNAETGKPELHVYEAGGMHLHNNLLEPGTTWHQKAGEVPVLAKSDAWGQSLNKEMAWRDGDKKPAKSTTGAGPTGIFEDADLIDEMIELGHLDAGFIREFANQDPDSKGGKFVSHVCAENPGLTAIIEKYRKKPAKIPATTDGVKVIEAYSRNAGCDSNWGIGGIDDDLECDGVPEGVIVVDGIAVGKWIGHEHLDSTYEGLASTHIRNPDTGAIELKVWSIGHMMLCDDFMPGAVWHQSPGEIPVMMAGWPFDRIYKPEDGMAFDAGKEYAS